MVFKEQFQHPEHLHLTPHAGWGLRLPLACCHHDGWNISRNQALQVLQQQLQGRAKENFNLMLEFWADNSS